MSNLAFFSDYQQQAIRTEAPIVQDRFQMLSRTTARAMHGILGIADEAGELANALKGHLFYGKPFDHANVAEELGDIMWFMSLTATALGFSLEQIATANIAKLAKRYPEKFTEFLADEANRDRDAETRAMANVISNLVAESHNNAD